MIICCLEPDIPPKTSSRCLPMHTALVMSLFYPSFVSFRYSKIRPTATMIKAHLCSLTICIHLFSIEPFNIIKLLFKRPHSKPVLIHILCSLRIICWFHRYYIRQRTAGLVRETLINNDILSSNQLLQNFFSCYIN